MPIPNPRYLTRERAIALSDQLHGIANELHHSIRFTEDEVENVIAQHAEDQIDALSNAINSLASMVGEAWRIET